MNQASPMLRLLWFLLGYRIDASKVNKQDQN
jgi:hypothetical protein